MPQTKKPKKKRCYLCSQRIPVKIFSKYGFDVVKCNNCQLFSTKFQQNYQKFLQSYYDKEFFTGSNDRIGYSDYEGDLLPEQINMGRYLTRIKKFKKTGKLLDAGCATGLFLHQAKKRGFDPHGFDVSEYAIKVAKKKFGKKVKTSTVSGSQYKKDFFDLITMFDVIEHLKDPVKDLKHLKKFLKKDGILVINTGDVGSFLAKVQNKNWHFFVPPQHLFFFSKKTLTQTLDKAGFEVLQIDYKGKWLSLRYFLNLFRQIHASHLAQLLYDRVADNIIGKLPIYLNLFDNIIVYARKVPKKS